MSSDLAILYEHPAWFIPLFEALDRRGVSYSKVQLTDHGFDPEDKHLPAPVILSRVAMSGFLREEDHGIFYAEALLDHWSKLGADVLNGPSVLGLDSSKARQLSLISRLGLQAPRTKVVHRPQDLLAGSEDMTFPLLVKANIGGSGAGIVRFETREQLREAIADHMVPTSIDRVLLLQDHVPARGGTIMRVETLGGNYLYALEVESGDSFDLCPADACIAAPGKSAIKMRAVQPDQTIIDAVERIAQASELDVGGVELMIDDRDGVPRFYDINALSNFVANPIDVLGWEPHDRLVDYIVARIAGIQRS